MYKSVLQSIEGIAIYPIFTLLLFFSFFVAMVVWVIRMDKKKINLLSHLPFEDEKNVT